MQFPTIANYIDAVTNPYGRFRQLAGVEVVRNGYEEPLFCTGNDAVVFQVQRPDDPDVVWALKCYTRLPEHFEAIYDFLQGVDAPHLLRAERLSEEIYLYDAYDRGYFMPVVVMPWVEGTTLGQAVRVACHRGDQERLRTLAEAFDRLAAWLQIQPFAHGDLKHDNLMLRADGGLTLVDYDAMFVPVLEGCSCGLIGSVAYQDPRRNADFFGIEVDDYPMALIAVSLWALVDDPTLYATYNDGENLILNAVEIVQDISPLYDILLNRFEVLGDARLLALCRSLRHNL